MTVILGIDPGTNITGYGIIKLEESKPTYLHHEILKTGLKNMYTVKLSLIYDNTKRLISTTDIVNENIQSFENISTFSQYTFDNSSDWVGDGTGVEIQDIESTPYISSLDPNTALACFLDPSCRNISSICTPATDISSMPNCRMYS